MAYKHKGWVSRQVPTADDPRWPDWCQPLLDLLARPRDNDELDAWAKSKHLRQPWLPNMLSWLEIHRLVSYTRGRWQRTSKMTAEDAQCLYTRGRSRESL